MFAPRYFSPRYFAPRYFTPGVELPATIIPGVHTPIVTGVPATPIVTGVPTTPTPVITVAPGSAGAIIPIGTIAGPDVDGTTVVFLSAGVQGAVHSSHSSGNTPAETTTGVTTPAVSDDVRTSRSKGTVS